MITLNSLNRDIFNVNSAEFANVERERADIVTAGRLLMAERQGRANNELRLAMQKAADYTPVLDDSTYAVTSRNTRDKMFLYAARRVCSVTGEVAPATFAEFEKNQKKFMNDKTFLKVLAGIIRDVITPILPVTLSNAAGYLFETVEVPLGKTLELDVASNDIFFFEDDSWGASRSKHSNYLYEKTYTLNPRPRTAKATIKWYQMVGNNVDIGRFFNSIAAGMVSKITALGIKAMLTASTDGTIPSNLQFTNTSHNWSIAASRITSVNGERYNNAIGIGHPTALMKALPSGAVNLSNVNLDSALATMLGVEWAKYGYLGDYMGVSLNPLNDSIVPGTQNTTMQSLIPQDRIWIMAASGRKPISVGIEEGTPIDIELAPSETADMSLDITTTISMDARGTFGSKIAQINL